MMQRTDAFKENCIASKIIYCLNDALLVSIELLSETSVVLQRRFCRQINTDFVTRAYFNGKTYLQFPFIIMAIISRLFPLHASKNIKEVDKIPI